MIEASPIVTMYRPAMVTGLPARSKQDRDEAEMSENVSVAVADGERSAVIS